MQENVQSGQLQDVIVFHGDQCIASGPLRNLIPRIKAATDQPGQKALLVLDAVTSELVDFDFQGSDEEMRQRLTAFEPKAEKRGPGRPKLGVIAREVTLLPRHWDWLSQQPGGASVALRKLVEEARRTRVGADQLRRAQESAYRFMNTLAGDRENFEEALRAFYAGDRQRFARLIEPWPQDIREQSSRLAERAFELIGS